MKKKQNLFDLCICILIIFGMLYTVSNSTMEFFCTSGSRKGLIFGVLFFTLVFCLLMSITKYALFLLTAIFLLPKPFYIIDALKELCQSFPDFMKSIITLGYIDGNYIHIFSTVFSIFLFIITILIYYVSVGKRKSLYLLVAGVILYSGYYYYYENADFVLQCGIFIALGMMLYAFNNYRVNSNDVSDSLRVDRRYYVLKWLISMTVLMMLVLCISLFMSEKAHLNTPKWVANAFDNVTKDIGRLGKSNNDGDFSLARTGFQEDEKRLGGPVKLDQTVAFTLSSNDEIVNAHLRGSIKSYYTGESWKRVNVDEATYSSNDRLEIDPSLNISASVNQLSITYKGLSTHTIINSLYPLYVIKDNGYIFKDDSAQLACSDSINKDDSYSIAIKQYSFDRKRLINAIENFDNNELQEYLQLPDNISEDVYKLTKQIISDFDKPFLQASAIEYYLKSNYPYSLNTSRLPDGEEFVNYFLFDEHKGSCTYYATAMAVMCRIAGIPTRYVEGFAVSSAKKLDEKPVLNSDAHAWVELYFSNLGWITFDPTPGWKSAAINPYEVTEEDLRENTVNTEGEHEHVVPIIGEAGQQEKGSSNTNNTSKKSEAKEENSWKVWTVIASPFIVVLILVFFCYGYTHGKRRPYYIIFAVTRYGKTMGVPYTPGLSIREYFMELNKKAWVDEQFFLEYYEAYQYSNNNKESRESEKLILKNMYNNTSNRIGTWKAVWVYVTNPLAYIFKRK